MGVAGAMALGTVATATPAVATPRGRVWHGGRSDNGWPILEKAERFDIEGSGQSVRLVEGDAATILLSVARRFHYEIDQLREGDVVGHSTSRRVRERYESNHLSGTAIAIRPHAYPAGVKGGLYPHELVVVRDILAELGGVVVWGGDLKTPKESHFQIAQPPGHPLVESVARRIRGLDDSPGRGAGSLDAFDPARRRRASAFAEKNA